MFVLLKLFSENKYSQLMVMLSSYLRYLVYMASLQIHISRAYFRMYSYVHASCPMFSTTFESEIDLEEISFQGVIKWPLFPILWDLRAGLGKESTTPTDFLLTFILPAFYKTLDICYGSLATSQGPRMLFPPFSILYVYLKFLQYSWHHYPIWALVLIKDKAWGDASYRCELATKRNGIKIIWSSHLEYDLTFYVYCPKLLAMLFFYGIGYW